MNWQDVDIERRINRFDAELGAMAQEEPGPAHQNNI